MNNLIITDDYTLKVAIGKKIYEEKHNIYNERITGIMYKTINFYLNDAGEKEKQDAYFHSIYDYWVYGNDIDEEFTFDFRNKTDAEKREYITFRNRFAYMNHLNSTETRHFLDNKWDAYQLMKPYYRREAILIQSQDDYEKFTDFSNRHKKFVVKPVGLGKQKGVHKADVEETTPENIFTSILAERDQLHKEYPWGDSTAMMVEEFIQQDSSMASIHPSSIQTVRLVTIKVGDKVNIWYPRLDIGRANQFLYEDSSSIITAMIDPNSGVVINKVFSTSKEEPWEYHPDTGVRISGFKIPEWDKLIKMASELMLHVLPDTCYVGWDMALSTSGWCVVEGNWAGEFGEDQEGCGRGLKKELEALIGWTPNQKFWWQN